MASFGFQLNVKIVSGNTPCEFYNVYYNSVNQTNLATIVSSSLPATNVTYTQLTTTLGLLVEVPNSATTIIISGTCGYCGGFTQQIANYGDFKVANDSVSLCTAPPQRIYFDNTGQGNLATNVILYSDSRLTTPFLGYSYIVKNELAGQIYQVNSLTGQILGTIGQTC